jgi:hypothetical protein
MNPHQTSIGCLPVDPASAGSNAPPTGPLVTHGGSVVRVAEDSEGRGVIQSAASPLRPSALLEAEAELADAWAAYADAAADIRASKAAMRRAEAAHDRVTHLRRDAAKGSTS